jgi:hypothetical protein
MASEKLRHDDRSSAWVRELNRSIDMSPKIFFFQWTDGHKCLLFCVRTAIRFRDTVLNETPGNQSLFGQPWLLRPMQGKHLDSITITQHNLLFYFGWRCQFRGWRGVLLWNKITPLANSIFLIAHWSVLLTTNRFFQEFLRQMAEPMQPGRVIAVNGSWSNQKDAKEGIVL